jgi:superfamily I DNA/RNA helicase
MKPWLISPSELTPEQKKMVEISPRESILITGTPGSGKTLVLVHRAAFFLQSQGASPQNIRFFVPTDVLEEFIGSEVESLGYSREMVTTFDHWCRSFFLKYISQDLPRIYVDGRIDYRKTRFAVLDALKKNGNFRKSLEYALVDDGQDLTSEAFEILSLAARYLTVFCYSRQRLNQEGTPESFIVETLKINKGNSSLEGDFRSSPSVAHLAARFIADDDFRYAYLSQARTAQGPSEDPLCYVARSEEKEMLHLSQIVRQKLVQKNRVGILVATNSLVHSLAKSLLDKGIETEKAITLDAQNVIHMPYDFRNNLPKITTYSMAKGLTFDSVLLPRLTEGSFSNLSSNHQQQLLFMGISRASQWVYLSTVKGQEFQEMATLRSAQSDGHLRIVHKVGFE